MSKCSANNRNYLKIVIFLFSIIFLFFVVAANASTIYVKKLKGNDWIELSDGELLQGEIINLYDGELEFDSNNLGTIKIPWSEVKRLTTHDPVNIGLTDLTSLRGKLRIENKKVYIKDRVLNPNEIMSVVASKSDAIDYANWSGKVALGLNLYSGNTDQLNYTAFINGLRRTVRTRFKFDYIGNYSRSDNKSIVNNHRVNSNVDIFLLNRFYIRPLFTEFYKDPFQNLYYKYSLGSGLGYDILASEKSKWSVTFGPAYTQSVYKVNDVTERNDSASAVLTSAFKTELADNLDLKINYNAQYANDATGGFNHNALVGLSVAMTDNIKMNTAVLWDYIAHPTSNAGVTPKNNDYQLIVGFEVKI